MLEKQLRPHLRKIWYRFPLYFVLFHSPQPNNKGPARQQPRDWGSIFNFSESCRGRGTQLLLISFVTTRLHGICNGSINGMEDGGGGAHTPAQKCFILHDQTRGDLKSHHLQARVTLTALSVPPGPPFLSFFFFVFLGH